MAAAEPEFDMLIVGAGISGIGMAAHLRDKCPDRTFAIIEGRENLGGTWDLFKYPGIRSDSDMHTLGFSFEPWRYEKSIADGATIVDYLNGIVDDRDIRRHIHFGQKVLSADWSDSDARWTVTSETAEGERKQHTARWVHLGSGYYDYDEPYDAGFDLSSFTGVTVHPQFWPEDLDYTGKKVVVIGSGATAVTLVPAMTDKAAHVTMLQRTPTWMFARPARDGIANFLRKILPEKLAYRITRWKNIRMTDYAFKLSRRKPEKMKEGLKQRLKDTLGSHYDDVTFTPPYNPWDQRLCLVPDDDLFEAMREGKAEIVTGHIEGFEKGGVRLKSGDLLEADVIVTATGLKLAVAGKIAVSQDGVPVDFAQRFYYKGCMFSNLPNLSAVFGYVNASWTLRADLNSEYVCKVLNTMSAQDREVAEAVMTPEMEAALEEEDLFDFSSGYIQRSKHLMPRNATDMRWRLNQDYLADRKFLREDPVDDGVLKLRHASIEAARPAQLEAAE